MIVVIHLDAGDLAAAGAEAPAERAEDALSVLAARPGFVRGSAGPCVDEPEQWLLVTEWRSVGDYRRALGAYEVKVAAAPLLARAQDLPSAFEQVVRIDGSGAVQRAASDHAGAGPA